MKGGMIAYFRALHAHEDAVERPDPPVHPDQLPHEHHPGEPAHERPERDQDDPAATRALPASLTLPARHAP